MFDTNTRRGEVPVVMVGVRRYLTRTVSATAATAVLISMLSLLNPLSTSLSVAAPAQTRVPSARGDDVAATAVPRLNWRPCADPSQAGFQCATAKVPLNYSKPAGRKISLAVIRRPADDPARRIGSVFFNPGGPGGPGVAALPGVTRFFPEQVRARFDLVSWDPRGVGQSTAVQCFPNPSAAARFVEGFAAVPVTKAQQKQTIAASKTFSKKCGKNNSDALLRHVSTADSARDLDRLRAAVGDSKLNYLGISYGTFLGATYANLFPKRVRAVVLDSNVNPKAWVDPMLSSNKGRFLSTFLRQKSDEGSQQNVNGFLDHCGAAPVAQCAFSAGTPAATRAKFVSLVRQMRSNPNATRGGLTYSELIDQTVDDLYYVQVWPVFAQTLQAVWLNEVPRVFARSAIEKYAGPEQAMGIICGESPNPKPSALPDGAKLAEARSGPTGDYWAWSSPGCDSWPVKAASRYAGPWNKKTSNTVLVVGVTTDPATPYRGSVAMSEQLRRARLLKLKGYGHTALINHSACVNDWEARYFVTGKVPPKGTTCSQDLKPFAP